MTVIESLYQDNPFHCFEHASHVAQSVMKLLGRIVAPDIDLNDQNAALQLHDHTYGITSDPLTQFACFFSALIHDVDHQGIPNTQLIKENSTLATFYKGKSIAEQHSVDLAWALLMDDRYINFRRAIFANENELQRFRQLVVNSVSHDRNPSIYVLCLNYSLTILYLYRIASIPPQVMATDIMDKELKQLRNGRWDKAFKKQFSQEVNHGDSVNRKATIVIEHLIQASDVCHTMQ